LNYEVDSAIIAYHRFVQNARVQNAHNTGHPKPLELRMLCTMNTCMCG